MLIVEHRGEPGTDRPAGEENPNLVARCPNPRCPSNQPGGPPARARATEG